VATVGIVVDWRSKSLRRNNFQALLVTGEVHLLVIRTDSDLGGPFRKVNSVIVSPLESIFELPLKVLAADDVVLLDRQIGAVGGEVASDTSCHCMGPQRLA